ncbi:hypothetical protein ACIBG8_48755 [Nonomuraea sp. NPDC050556]|uniref:hypothetical protein n=1 Tax=Nonomuraea sp. NPDC050556 TaxID=3364369 RepID=UPI0037BBD334
MIRRLILIIAAVTLISTVPAAAETGTVRLRTQQILRFEQLAGQTSWQTSAYNRVANAYWVFYSNGTFAFNTTNVRTDLYPLYGKYQVNGNTVAFSAHNSAGGAFTEMIGRIDFGARTPVMKLNWASGAGYGAVVNNQRFGATASSHYAVTLTVAQV